MTHPAFLRAALLTDECWRRHFPTSTAEAQTWAPCTIYRALSSRVLVVAVTRIECAWAAYIDAVPGQRHADEIADVMAHGAKVDEPLARLLFPTLNEVPYAR